MSTNWLAMMQAFDVVGVREVAVKIHQLNSAWSEGKKQSYVKHAVCGHPRCALKSTLATSIMWITNHNADLSITTMSLLRLIDRSDMLGASQHKL